MSKIYVSSTYSDLKDYREAVYGILRKLRHNVIAMEDYVATDERPLQKCVQDVVGCNLYVGIFAWRYGYIPPLDNPEQQSITELEYRKACEVKIPCLLFLLDEVAPWPDTAKDSVTGEGDKGQRIALLRAQMQQEKVTSFFKTPDQLGGLVSVAVQQSIPRSASMSVVGQIKAQALDKRLVSLTADYQAATEQLTYLLGAVEQTRLKRQLDALEREIEAVATELRALQ